MKVKLWAQGCVIVESVTYHWAIALLFVLNRLVVPGLSLSAICVIETLLLVAISVMT